MSPRFEKVLIGCAVLIALAVVWALVGWPLYRNHQYSECMRRAASTLKDTGAGNDTLRLVSEICTKKSK